MTEKRTCASENEPKEKKAKTLTYFDDIPDEILLIICHYLNPAHVIKAFCYYDQRLFSCISEYRQNIDLTKCSYSDFQYFLLKLNINGLQPLTITVSNAKMPTQIELFFQLCYSPKKFPFKMVRHLSLLELTEKHLYDRLFCLEKFKFVQSLKIIQSTSEQSSSSMDPLLNGKFRQPIFSTFYMLTELELTINHGIILDKQISPNIQLKRLIISLQTMDDLYLLLDGLAPELSVLHVTVCQPNAYTRSPLPSTWPNQIMSELIEFQLITSEKVSFNFDQLRNIVMPMTKLDELTLIVKNWTSDHQQFIEGYQLEMLIQQYLPELYYFFCSIMTFHHINMQTFETLNKRWSMKCRSGTYGHLYTIPWRFEQLHTSMLANDDTSVCPAVRSLIVDMNCTDLSHRFPNINTLTILPSCNLSPDNYTGFLHLRCLAMSNINTVPSSVIKNVHTLTLSYVNELLTHPTIYSNIKDLILTTIHIDSSVIINAIVQHFPNLHSLNVRLQSNTNYYDYLDILLDNANLPYLSLLQTNSIDNEIHCTNINLWITAKTRLKWRSTPFYGHCDAENLTIRL